MLQRPWKCVRLEFFDLFTVDLSAYADALHVPDTLTPKLWLTYRACDSTNLFD